MTTPAYQQIKNYVLAAIHAGEWREGDLVPSENELVKRFHVARMTVNRAIRELAAEGVLTRSQGAGTFVAATKYQSTLIEIKSIADEIRARGHVHSAEVLKLQAVKADAALAAEMGVATGGRLFHSLILHHENGVPIQLEDRWVNPALASDYLSQDFTVSTPNEYLTRVAPLSRVEYRIEASRPDRTARAKLAMIRDEPCLVLHRRTFSASQVASMAKLYHPAGRYQFSGYF
ncbi:histidine utilization repressor [Chitinimonas sp. BJB300]|uniref:histidine utilization repressor n=1 Tax=Chitinimonas sp. BJB300 TaxID=1559339 RepID=UPI000C111A3D|nr:histidine utilization repressor [Chitinimonas sp. BJB300]PHV10691.1 histidine utilization repressor [Chitinimonas sp. BJB300]TSJ90771.1 histidine utilization repressor [Chitinimonas sp. BJB300]